MSNAVSLVEYTSVSKAYGNNVVLDGIDFAVDEGEFSVVFGQSASGKSVLLRILLGLDHPDQGTVLLRGADAADTKPGARKIGYVPQSFALFPDKTVRDNIAYTLIVQHNSRTTIKEAVGRVAGLLDISELLDRTPDQLSGGQKQRVAIARGLALATDLYVLDDPLVGLDFKLREKLIDDLRETREALGVTFLYATSDATEALALASKVGVLNEGTIQEYGLPNAVYRKPERFATMATLCFPQSNQLPVTISDGDIVTPWGSVPAAIDASAKELSAIAALVRPERIALRSPSNRNSLEGQATVMLREDLGAEEIVYLESDGHRLTSLVRADSADLGELSLGAKVQFTIPADAIVLFADGHRAGQGRS
ncbi:MAG: ABC transporter ATP-binding protein [Acidimicrobiia bacterium]|nr:ABC transporter ATP-binding protein [Acidimicrobiia bacterium]